MNNVRGAIMLDQNLTTLLSVALGGVLAITGGFISNNYIQATARKSEKRRVVHEKIDELYTLALFSMGCETSSAHRITARSTSAPSLPRTSSPRIWRPMLPSTERTR